MKTTERFEYNRILKNAMINILESRRKNFAIKVSKYKNELAEPGECILEITYNGRQWTPLTLLPEEVDKVIAKLQAYRDKNRGKKVRRTPLLRKP